MRYFQFLLYGLLLPLFALGQDVVVTGVVKSDAGYPVPYATIKFRQAGKGTVANQQGRFVLKVSAEYTSDTIEFSSIGFQPELLPVSEASKGELNMVLREETYDLPIAQVDADGLRNVIKKAIENISNNFQLGSYSYPAFYRQYHVENEKCVRLLEAALDVYDPGYGNTTSSAQLERLDLLEMRKSKVYEMNNGTHGNHLADLLAENSVHYRIGSVLNEKSLSFFQFYRDPSDKVDGDVKKIRYKYKNAKDEKVREGVIWLKGEQFVISMIEERFYPNPEYKGPWARNTGGYDWILRQGKKVIQYREVNGVMYLDSISYSYKHDLIHPTFHSNDFTVEEHFQLWCGEPKKLDENYSPDRRYKKEYNLYGKRYHYNPTFWADYPLYLMCRPINSKLKSDLEWKEPLEEQFLRNGTN